MKRFIFVLIISFSCIFSGCATWSTSSVDKAYVAEGATEVSKKNPEKVVVTERDISDRKYKILGDITVTVNKTTVFHPEPTRELVNIKLQERASELGADAVILVRYGKVGVAFFSWGSLEGKGRAVKFEN
jgi:uncharacterized protein YbjQ (UPF0145 family)